MKMRIEVLYDFSKVENFINENKQMLYLQKVQVMKTLVALKKPPMRSPQQL